MEDGATTISPIDSKEGVAYLIQWKSTLEAIKEDRRTIPNPPSSHRHSNETRATPVVAVSTELYKVRPGAFPESSLPPEEASWGFGVNGNRD